MAAKCSEARPGKSRGIERGIGATGMGWSNFDSGKSLGTMGTEDGVIRRDEEHDEGARITMEQGGKTAPWSITCGIYGWTYMTRYFTLEQDCKREYDLMK